jgi:hypothetical protein
VALGYLLRTLSAGGGSSKYPWTAEQYLRITPGYESRRKKSRKTEIREWRRRDTNAEIKGEREREREREDGGAGGSRERAIHGVETETRTSGGLWAGVAVGRN